MNVTGLSSLIANTSPVAGVIISVALMLFSGFAMTRLTKLARLPNVTGYILAGILIGPYVLNLVPQRIIDGTDFLSDIALAFIAFSTGELKKYKVTINDLLAENEKLEARAKASEKGKMKDTMERAKLKSELDNLQRLVDRIPPDILAELKRQQRHTVKER